MGLSACGSQGSHCSMRLWLAFAKRRGLHDQVCHVAVARPRGDEDMTNAARVAPARKARLASASERRRKTLCRGVQRESFASPGSAGGFLGRGLSRAAGRAFQRKEAALQLQYSTLHSFQRRVLTFLSVSVQLRCFSCRSWPECGLHQMEHISFPLESPQLASGWPLPELALEKHSCPAPPRSASSSGFGMLSSGGSGCK